MTETTAPVTAPAFEALDRSLMNTLTMSQNSSWAHVEAHAEGCRAAGRRSGGQPTEVYGPFTVESIVEMQSNPDEGIVKIHACARPLFKV